MDSFSGTPKNIFHIPRRSRVRNSGDRVKQEPLEEGTDVRRNYPAVSSGSENFGNRIQEPHSDAVRASNYQIAAVGASNYPAFHSGVSTQNFDVAIKQERFEADSDIGTSDYQCSAVDKSNQVHQVAPNVGSSNYPVYQTGFSSQNYGLKIKQEPIDTDSAIGTGTINSQTSVVERSNSQVAASGENNYTAGNLGISAQSYGIKIKQERFETDPTGIFIHPASISGSSAQNYAKKIKERFETNPTGTFIHPASISGFSSIKIKQERLEADSTETSSCQTASLETDNSAVVGSSNYQTAVAETSNYQAAGVGRDNCQTAAVGRSNYQTVAIGINNNATGSSGSSAENYSFANPAVEMSNLQAAVGNVRLDNSKASLYRIDERVNPGIEGILCRIPKEIVQTHIAHTDVITSLNWCIQRHSYLYLSSSLDGKVKIWDMYKNNSLRCIEVQSALNFAKWSLDGCQIVIGGSDKKAHVYDTETAKKIHSYNVFNVVTSAAIHPYIEDVFACGTRNAILGFDLRAHDIHPIRTFLFQNCQEIRDIVFIDEKQLVCSSSSNAADKSLMVLSFGNGQKLSNKILPESFRCTSIKVHPINPWFGVQCDGGYIAAFLANEPYTSKNKKFCGHKVGRAIPIEFDFSPDGKYIVSGDEDGNVHYYNCAGTSPVFVSPYSEKIPINRVNWHPGQTSTVLTSTLNGKIHIWK